MQFSYHFPECKRYEGTYPQLCKIYAECHEVVDSYTDGNDEHTVEELFDVIHACETLIRNMTTPEQAASIRDSVIEKNRSRGYYDAT